MRKLFTLCMLLTYFDVFLKPFDQRSSYVDDNGATQVFKAQRQLFL
jgi:hypothetical protein